MNVGRLAFVFPLPPLVLVLAVLVLDVDNDEFTIQTRLYRNVKLLSYIKEHHGRKGRPNILGHELDRNVTVWALVTSIAIQRDLREEG